MVIWLPTSLKSHLLGTDVAGTPKYFLAILNKVENFCLSIHHWNGFVSEETWSVLNIQLVLLGSRSIHYGSCGSGF
jgi:hypothetical protein